MAVANLNLAVSAVSFVVITQKLQQLEKKLNEIQKDVKAIREMLILDERAKLFSALENLKYVASGRHSENHRELLFEAKQILTPVNIKYRELLASTTCLELSIGYEEYFSLTSLAHNRCLAELGMLDIAKEKMIDDCEFWRQQAKRIASESLLGEHPERFLFNDFVGDVPVHDLTAWLDFAYDEKKGFAWIDDLRGRMTPWYANLNYTGVGKGAAQVISSVNTMFSKKLNPKDIDKQMVIPNLQKITAKDKVFTGYVAQYELLEKNDMTPTQLEGVLRNIDSNDLVDGFLVLQVNDFEPELLN
jgi:hypothetical protein